MTQLMCMNDKAVSPDNFHTVSVNVAISMTRSYQMHELRYGGRERFGEQDEE